MIKSLTILSFCVICCSGKKTENTITEHDRIASTDTCSFCSYEASLINPIDLNIHPKKIIDYPVALVFFNNTNFIFKYEQTNYDTVMKFFKMKHWGDRNQIYEHYDNYGYYKQGIKPKLLKWSIAIDTLIDEQYVEFRYQHELYIIDLKPYKYKDGVVMFKPGKKPVFWTMDIDWQSCHEYYVFPTWYFKCP